MVMSWPLRIATLKKGVLVPPAGFVFLVDTDGAILTDSDGTYLITEA